MEHEKVLLNNSVLPDVSVAAIAKKDLPAGTPIPQAIGSFEFRGEAVRIADAPDHVPIGLIQGAELARPVERGQTILANDVDIPASRAASGWQAVRERVLAAG